MCVKSTTDSPTLRVVTTSRVAIDRTRTKNVKKAANLSKTKNVKKAANLSETKALETTAKLNKSGKASNISV